MCSQVRSPLLLDRKLCWRAKSRQILAVPFLPNFVGNRRFFTGHWGTCLGICWLHRHDKRWIASLKEPCADCVYDFHHSIGAFLYFYEYTRWISHLLTFVWLNDLGARQSQQYNLHENLPSRCAAILPKHAQERAVSLLSWRQGPRLVALIAPHPEGESGIQYLR